MWEESPYFAPQWGNRASMQQRQFGRRCSGHFTASRPRSLASMSAAAVRDVAPRSARASCQKLTRTYGAAALPCSGATPRSPLMPGGRRRDHPPPTPLGSQDKPVARPRHA
eukprot:gene19280-biopygen10016